MLEEILQDDLTLFALPVYLVAILIEAWHAQRAGLARYRLNDTLASLSMMLAAGAVELLPRLLAILLIIELHALSPLPDVVGRQWWAWLLLFVLDDFSYYWFHRANHSVRLLWAGHVNHHSSQYLNFGTALRQGVGERLHKYLFWLWLPLLGFDPAMIITMISLNLFYQFWVHTQSVGKLHPWFEFVFNTPSHHRVHHGSNPAYIDRNHGGVLIIWDRLFGTFTAEREDEPVVYGLTKNIDSDNPWTVLSHEYRAIWQDLCHARDWHTRLQILFRPPHWRAERGGSQ